MLHGGWINVVAQIGMTYRRFGNLLLGDATETDRIIDLRADKKPSAINLIILKKWVHETGRSPWNWDTLLAVLREVGGLEDLVRTISENLTSR